MTMGMGMMVAALIFFIGKCWRQPHTNQFCYSQLMVLTSSASSPPRCTSTANQFCLLNGLLSFVLRACQQRRSPQQSADQARRVVVVV